MAHLAKLQKRVKDLGLDALIVTHLPNIRYLTGFSGSAGLLIIPAQGKPHFFTDFRYKLQVKDEVGGAKMSIVDRDRTIYDAMAEKQLFSDYDSLGFEQSHLLYSEYDLLRKKFRHVKLVPIDGEVEKLTMVKTEEEISCIKKAAEIGDKVFKHLLNVIKPGMTELDVSAEISYQAKLGGSERDAFTVIVASGERSALPHGVATEKKLKKGDVIILDYGCVYKGFNSDMTRTIALGKLPVELTKIYDIVRNAQQRAIDKAVPGINGRELDSVARDYITLHGYGSKFGHATGHGLGIDVHELPRISQRGERFKLEVNQVITIEPGIYIEKLGGVRIEDDIVIRREGGAEVITTASKELITL